MYAEQEQEQGFKSYPEGYTVVQHQLELTSPIVLCRHDRSGKPKKEVFRLEVGERVFVLARNPDPRSRYPFLCVHPLWAQSFYVGRGHKMIEVYLRRQRGEDGSFDWQKIEEVVIERF